MHIRRLASWHAPVFLVNSRYPLACATPHRSRAAWARHRGGSPLCRRHGSGLPSSLTRIRSLASVYSTCPPVSVWGTGGRPPRAEAFLGRRDHRISGHQGPHHHASPHAAPGFAWGRGRTLDQGKPPPRPATRPRHSMRSTPGRHARTRTSPTNPKEGRIRWKHAIGQGTADRSCGRYGNIDPFIHSTTPVGLALGPDSPRDDERGPGTLGHPAAGILTLLSLLMSAFSLP